MIYFGLNMYSCMLWRLHEHTVSEKVGQFVLNRRLLFGVSDVSLMMYVKHRSQSEGLLWEENTFEDILIEKKQELCFLWLYYSPYWPFEITLLSVTKACKHFIKLCNSLRLEIQ